jgi:DNA-binding transcriptional MerR regulator
MDTWTVGELAAATGLTVRTLHHYDEIGLARPSEQRSSAGYRRYTAADVRRLHRIVALRGFGFSLVEIGGLLDSSELDPRELIQRQLDQADDRIRRATRLRDRLEAVLDLFDAAGNPSAEVLVRLIEEMTAVDHTYTPEEFEQLAAHRRELMAQLSPEQLEEMTARRRAQLGSLTPGQLADLQRSRPLPPQP